MTNEQRAAALRKLCTRISQFEPIRLDDPALLAMLPLEVAMLDVWTVHSGALVVFSMEGGPLTQWVSVDGTCGYAHGYLATVKSEPIAWWRVLAFWRKP